MNMKIKVINKSKHKLPEYKTKGAAGMDILANLDETVVLKPLERTLIPTGLYMEIPEGYEVQIRPRSGMALKEGIGILNSPGTIDSDYRGEVGVIVINLSDKPVKIEDGQRICQMVVNPILHAEWSETSSLEITERGNGGFGHTGK